MASKLSSRCSLSLFFSVLLFVATAGAAAGAPGPKVTLLGDASIKNGSISLTCGDRNCLGAGRALHSHPVRLRDPCTNRALSFSSNFTFSITPIDGTFGDGFAFLVTPDASHDNMGILHNHRSPNNQAGTGIATVAVEFDVNGNHVTLNVGNKSSVVSADASSTGVVLTSLNKMRAWVEYDGDREELRMWLSYGHGRPPVPLISTKVDLSGLLHDNMFIGFSASNGRGAAMHIVEWKFQTSPLVARALTSTSTSMSRGTRVALGLGLGIGLAAVLAVVVTGCMIYRRRRNIRHEEPEKSVDNLV